MGMEQIGRPPLHEIRQPSLESSHISSRLAKVRSRAIIVSVNNPDLLSLSDIDHVFDYTTEKRYGGLYVDKIALRPKADFEGKDPYTLTSQESVSAFETPNKAIYTVVDALLTSEPPYGKHKHDLNILYVW